MNSKSKAKGKTVGALFLLLAPLLFSLPVIAQSLASNSGNEKYAIIYRFTNERFDITMAELDFDESGRGRFRFRKNESDQDIENPIALSANTVRQVITILDQLSFLTSGEEYQYEKQFPHMGTHTIRVRQGNRQREVSFNYTRHPLMEKLQLLLFSIRNQEERYFNLDLARHHYPLDTPQQLRILQNEMKSKRIAEPERFLPILREMSLDEHLPLIARNHAQRLIKEIEKNKK